MLQVRQLRRCTALIRDRQTAAIRAPCRTRNAKTRTARRRRNEKKRSTNRPRQQRQRLQTRLETNNLQTCVSVYSAPSRTNVVTPIWDPKTVRKIIIITDVASSACFFAAPIASSPHQKNRSLKRIRFSPTRARRHCSVDRGRRARAI